MSRMVVTTPVFGAFRSGEGRALKLANRALEFNSNKSFDTKIVTKEGTFRVKLEGREISVYLNEKDKPFSFMVEEYR